MTAGDRDDGLSKIVFDESPERVSVEYRIQYPAVWKRTEQRQTVFVLDENARFPGRPRRGPNRIGAEETLTDLRLVSDERVDLVFRYCRVRDDIVEVLHQHRLRHRWVLCEIGTALGDIGVVLLVEP
ncbi:hypothetical protein [Halorubrum sp. HHNYT27]|uniref:hypothetical protein n=1 Tax=Halorubrum sp. HHNYT27 TaxID=3402275 RepID=UPI003EBA5FAA